MLGNRLDPEGAKSMKKGRCGNILEPQSTALSMAAVRWCAREWSSEQKHIFWHFAISFLDVSCSQPFQKRSIELLVHVNAINPGSRRAEVLQCPRTLSLSPCRLTSQLFLLWRSWRREVPLVRLVLAHRDQVRNPCLVLGRKSSKQIFWGGPKHH